MTAEITIEELYWNRSVRNFFMRTRSECSFNEFLDCGNKDEHENRVEFLEGSFDELDELEEWFYNTPDEEIMEDYNDWLGL